jgi:hypothetical protein
MSFVWLAWLIAIAASFAVFEGYALRNDKRTLSRTVWMASRAWPPLPCIFGIVVGILISHFWWIGQACDLVP